MILSLPSLTEQQKHSPDTRILNAETKATKPCWTRRPTPRLAPPIPRALPDAPDAKTK